MTLSRSHWLVAFVAVAVILAWTGLLDSQSMAYVDGALLGSGAIYATARSINALVSVLQGTEITPIFVTISIGELLDPINDLIERFSGVMLLAMASLAVQKILLEVVSHTIFNLLLTGLGLAAIAAHFRGNAALYKPLARVFVITVMTRFALVLMVLLNSWADAVFLEENEQLRHQEVQAFAGELEEIGNKAGLEQEEASGPSFTERVSGAFSTFDMKSQIEELNEDVSEFSASLVNLLMSVVLKSVLFPLLFLYLIIRLASRIG